MADNSTQLFKQGLVSNILAVIAAVTVGMAAISVAAQEVPGEGEAPGQPEAPVETPDPTPQPDPEPEPADRTNEAWEDRNISDLVLLSGGNGHVATEAATGAVVSKIQAVRAICERLPVEVRIDCLSDQFRTLARELPKTGAYAPVRKALLDAADDLNRVTRTFEDSATPRRRFATADPAGPGRVTTGRLRAVQEASAVIANREAEAVIDELQTVLLRSAENARQRRVHYEEISTALNSTKVLLRSA